MVSRHEAQQIIRMGLRSGSDDYTAKTLKHDSAQKTLDARREIFQE